MLKSAKELHKPIHKTIKKRKVHSSFLDDVWGADPAETKLISINNEEFRFLLCVIDIYIYI